MAHRGTEQGGEEQKLQTNHLVPTSDPGIELRGCQIPSLYELSYHVELAGLSSTQS
jgi:hypothetical protein